MTTQWQAGDKGKVGRLPLGYERSGRVWILGDGVNTDALYPGHALAKPIDQAARHVLEGTRPGWAEQVQVGDVIVGGTDFGIGSSRPVATLLRHLGIGAVVAEGMSSLFFRNSINLGLPVMTAPGVKTILEEGDIARVDVGLGTVSNAETGASVNGERYPLMLLRILDAGGLIQALRAQGHLAQRGAPSD